MNRGFLLQFQEFAEFSKNLLSGKFDAEHKHSQSGQTLVEFMLLLFIIVFLSHFFMGIVNTNIKVYWQYMVNLVVDDKAFPMKIK